MRDAKAYQVVPAEIRYVYALEKVLRDKDRAKIEATGHSVKKALYRAFRNSIMVKTAFVKQYGYDEVLTTMAEDTAALEREKHDIIRHLHDELEAVTGKTGKIEPEIEDRVVEIMTRERESDVLAAYDRAIMEDAERDEGRAHERRKHPGTSDNPGMGLFF
jgi:hypothetical protein